MILFVLDWLIGWVLTDSSGCPEWRQELGDLRDEPGPEHEVGLWLIFRFLVFSILSFRMMTVAEIEAIVAVVEKEKEEEAAQKKKEKQSEKK